MFCAGYGNIYIDEPLSQWRHYGWSTSSNQARHAGRYARKLIARFPEHAGSTLARRFIPVARHLARSAARNRDAQALRSAISTAMLFADHLSVHHRIRLMVANALLRHWSIARIPLLRPAQLFPRVRA